MAPATVDRPAFDMPGGENARTRRSRPIDFEQLSRQTMGDRALEQEVLALFVHHATAIGEQIVAADREQRIRLAHGLKGSSRSVGAFPVADCAEQLEQAPDDMATVQRLRRRVAEVAEVVASISR